MIYVTGDTHGDFNDYRINHFVPKIMQKDDYLIICGDFGFDWNKSLIDNYQKIKFNGTVLFVDGNHENFDILNSLPTKEMFESDVGVFCESENNHTYHLRRGRMYEINGKKFFCFGGASSIDKEWRIIEEMKSNSYHTLWWEDETPTETEYDSAIDTLKKYDYKFDYFITHACNPDLKDFILGTYKKDFFDITEDMIGSIEWNIKENNGSYLGHFFGHYHMNCGSGKEHCLYDNIVNLDQGIIMTNHNCAYKFDINGNQSYADFGVKIKS